ncbi:DUF397 domain-containing protein [Actinomadura viridis]|uniref:DUF397 domain-containing protein n=1 Tax=Actinomadura viridis TaxID=58110 RepID=A0A931DQB7_9ACTN|nr:DUF397 domain-containing protein [Actinomadura viridis]MBG6092829.1 hypothetical protein [Actinomadura viridis]
MVDRRIRGDGLDWRKSSASGEGGDDCVEVAATGRSVLVRDSHAPRAGTLELGSAEWRTFLSRIQNGDLSPR